MALLINTSDVIEALGLSTTNEEDIDATVTRAIRAAQTRMEVEIDSAVERYTCRDLFYVDTDKFNGVDEHGMLCLRLKNGFASVTSMGYSGSPKGPFTPISTEQFLVNEDHGLVFLDKEYDRSYLEVWYTSGFLSRAEAPQNVRQAIMYFVPLALKLSIQPDAESKKKADDSAKISEALVTGMRRPFGIQFRPFVYTKTPVLA